MEWGRVFEIERMPSLVGGNTELIGGKWKNWKEFSKPNFERVPNRPG